MRVLGKEPRELQRPDAKRQFERHLETQNVASEPAEPAAVIGLVEARALHEEIGDRTDRQEDRQHDGCDNDGGKCHQHNAPPL